MISLDTDHARGAVETGHMRYVLSVSLAAAVVAMAVTAAVWG